MAYRALREAGEALERLESINAPLEDLRRAEDLYVLLLDCHGLLGYYEQKYPWTTQET
jgi:hypothetical protein